MIQATTPRTIAIPTARSTASVRRTRGLSSPAVAVVDVMRGTFPVKWTRRKTPLARALLNRLRPGQSATARASRRVLLDRLLLEEPLLVVLHEQHRDVPVVGITCLGVDLDLLTQDRLVGRDVDAVAVEHLVGDALAGAVGLGDRSQNDLHRGHAVQRVVGSRELAVLGLVSVDQGLGGAATLDQLVGRQAR